MKKYSSIPIAFVFLVLIAGIARTQCEYLEVSPLSLHFPDTEVGSSATLIVNLLNHWFGDMEIMYEIKGSGCFTIAPTPPPVLKPGETGDVAVVFSPSTPGEFAGTLWIEAENGGICSQAIPLDGSGVTAEPTPGDQILDILAFFDHSVAIGTLVGHGPGNSADGRRGALRNMIVSTGDLLEKGRIEEACQQLKDAYNRTDGLPRPPEFVAGPAAPTLAAMIHDLLTSMGCTSAAPPRSRTLSPVSKLAVTWGKLKGR